jgi:SpoVK/Ycf46/Vps4 family AAA+-type ATPase
VIEAIGRCVVWLDEIEKALQGATSASADGGVSADALGTVLTWMQERQGGAFVIATANEVENLPPELLRKGRFDEMWFVDLPTEIERHSVLSAALRANGRGDVKIDTGAVGRATDNFTGAEIAALVPDALYAAFADEAREITTADLIAAAKTVVPLAETAKEKVKKLRDWSQGRARPATRQTETKSSPSVRSLDL